MSTVSATPRVTWSDTIDLMDWNQGEHVTLVGPTGRGKTELEVAILTDVVKRWAVFLGTKRKDSTQDELKGLGYRTAVDGRGINPQISDRFILRAPWPSGSLDPSTLRDNHRKVYEDGLLNAFQQTGWTIAADEAWYICQYLGLASVMELIWLQGRSQGNAIICATQRPRNIPLAAYSQATHIFLWRTPDLADVRRIAEVSNGMDMVTVETAFQSMDHHDILYINQITGKMAITNTRS